MPGFRRRFQLAARPLAVLVAVAAAPGLTAGGQSLSPDDLARRIQAHYATVRDFTADFELAQASGLLPREAIDRGRVEVKKPGRMRWTFTTGDRNQVVSDGVRTYSYFPRDKYVAIAPLPAGDDASTALLFLTGRGDITRDFTASLPGEPPPGEWHLALAPRRPQADFVTLTLQVDRRSLALRGLVVVDAQGGTQRFRFSNLRENRGLPDSLFEFTIPRGVEIR